MFVSGIILSNALPTEKGIVGWKCTGDGEWGIEEVGLLTERGVVKA
jgi:hypothetical protein